MATKSSTKKEARFIGVSIEEFLDVTSKEVKAGKYQDGTTIHPKIREALDQFTGSLQQPRLRPRHYIFVFDRFIFIKIEF